MFLVIPDLWGILRGIANAKAGRAKAGATLSGLGAGVAEGVASETHALHEMQAVQKPV